MNLLSVEIMLLIISISLDFIMVSVSRTERHLRRIAEVIEVAELLNSKTSETSNEVRDI